MVGSRVVQHEPKIMAKAVFMGKSIINMSDHMLHLDKTKVISQGLNFCPTTDMDLIGLTADTEEFIRRCINARFISCAHKIAQNITQAQRNSIHALNTNRNIVTKPVDKGGAIVVQNRTDYCKE
eukprot:g31160.t1